jgi:uncharacterized membrane protein
MNDAHLHLLVNHIPILGTLFGIGILIGGILFRNKVVKNCAYLLFITSTICALLAMNTGEGAEELVEDLPNIGHQIIHEHEEIAEKFVILMYVLGAFSILGLVANQKNHAKAKLLAIIIVALGLINFAVGTKVGTTGGEIRHTEIRSNYNPSQTDTED